MNHAEKIDAEWLRQRLSAVAKQEGGEDSTARNLRNRLVEVGVEGLTEDELALAMQLIGAEHAS